jgi:uncharacterized protein (TIGR02145 family)
VKTKDVEVLDSTAPGSTVTFTAFNPSVSAATSTVWYLVDERVGGNSETYKVKKLQDGHIWMVQDLKFGDCPNSTTNWYTDTSAAATTHTPTVYSGYVGHCRASSQANAGYLYNWPAAMQNSNAYYGSSSNVGCSGTSASTTGTNPGACQGICPSGWHIPTGDSSGEYQALHNAIGGCSTSNDNCWNATSVWEGVKGRACNLYGQIWYAETIAGYFSSTPASINNAYNLKFAPNHTYPGTNDVCKNCGFTVRCVMNY